MRSQTIAALIRELSAQRPDPSKRSMGGVLRSPALRGIEAKERIEAEIQPYLEALIEEFPELVARRRLFDGSWQVGVAMRPAAEDEGAAASATRGRLVFDLRVDPHVRQVVDVRCRLTAEGSDGRTCSLKVNAAHDLSDLRDFAQQRALAFASRLLGLRSRTGAS